MPKSCERGGEYHWRVYGIEELVQGVRPGARVLLLGCGDGSERPRLEDLGHRVVGLDIRDVGGVDLVADGHSVPLASGSVDVVLSMQVLEHLREPWVAIGEVARVLRPGGLFVGSVAFLKPFHGSYFHMTHWGVRSLCESAGLRVDRVRGAQSLTYSLLGSLLPVGSRGIRRRIGRSVDRGIFGLRRLAWSRSRGLDADVPTSRFLSDLPMSFRDFDELRYAPAVVFRAIKPAEDPQAPT